MNKKLRIGSQVEGEDRLSSLSDDVIHRILSFLGTRLAVQTSILSKRWRHIWTALPVLTFDGYDQVFPFTHSGIIKFIDHVLSHRNHQLNISSFKFFALYPIPRSLINRIIEYPISHNVQDLDFDLQFHRHYPFKLSTFSSDSIQNLRLGVHLDFGKLWESDGCWDLPVLTTLQLKCPIYMSNYRIPESCLVCLPALTTLRLDRCELPESVSISLPALTTLTMARCEFPWKVWEFPALITLELDDVLFPPNVSELFSELVSLRNLTIMFSENIVEDFFIYCPELVNLKISTSTSICITPAYRIEVQAMKLCRLYCVGIFLVSLTVEDLENATIKLWDTNEFNNLTMPKKKVFYRHLDRMFWELGSAKILTIDSATFEALSMHCNLFKNVSSPFYNLKYVKVPQGYKESSIYTTLRKYLLSGSPGATIVTALPQALTATDFLGSLLSPFCNLKIVKLPLGYKESIISSVLRSYLLGASRRATIVTTLPQSNMIFQKLAVSMTAQNALLQGSLAAPTKDINVQKEHVVEDSEVSDRDRHINALVEEICKDQVSSFTGNGDFGLWQGHKVNPEFVCLLDRIMPKYPETFEHFTTKKQEAMYNESEYIVHLTK